MRSWARSSRAPLPQRHECVVGDVHGQRAGVGGGEVWQVDAGVGGLAELDFGFFGGFAQFFVTWLFVATGSPIAPSFYVMFGAAIGVVAAFFLVDGLGGG